MTAALIVGGVSLVVVCVQAAVIYFLIEELANARVDSAAERSELVTRIQRPSYVPPASTKAHTPDQEKQRRIDAAMRQVGTYVPRPPENGAP